MRSTKRLLALILAGVMALALAACGNNGGSSTPAPAPATPAGRPRNPEPGVVNKNNPAAEKALGIIGGGRIN